MKAHAQAASSRAASTRDMLIGTISFTAAAAAFLMTTLCATTARSEPADTVVRNKAVVQQSFDAWAAGRGGPYALLKDDATWEITGRSAASKIYPSREAFISEVIRPFNARMKEPLKPAIRSIMGEGDTVVVLFDAAGVARDGKPYTNTYSWHLRLDGGRIASATAFFDSIAFNDLWSRVKPDAPQ